MSAEGDGSPYTNVFGSPSTESVSRATSDCTATAPAPTGLGVSSSTATSVTLTWDAVTDAAAYKLERSTSSTGPWTEVSSTITTTSHAVTGLINGTAYYFRVSAKGDGSPYTTTFGDPSSSLSETLGSTLASAPTGLTADSSAEHGVTLSWNAVADAAAYRMEHSTSSTGPWTEASSDITAITYEVTDLTCDTTHYFRVSARGDGSPHSNAFGSPTTSSVSRATGACVNDSPVFTSSSYSFTVSEDAEVDASVGTTSATDEDTNDTVSYSITTGNGDGKFDINSATGEITVAELLDFEITSSYTLTVGASDGNGGTGTATVTITVTDVLESSITVATSEPWAGQTTTITATTDAPSGSTLSYQWQEWSSGAWSNLGTASTTALYSATSTAAGTKFYRVVVTPATGSASESPPIVIQWKPMVVVVTSSPDYPESDDDPDESRVTLTADVEGPTGVSYQWQKWSGTTWTDLGTASNQTDTSTSRGTKKYRVVVSHATATSALSGDVFVTWDEWAILSDLITALRTAVTANTTYTTAQTALLTCMNAGREESDRFTSFDDILEDYSGDTETKMESEGTCSSEATAMFNSNRSASQDEVTTLKSGNTEYASLLATPGGRQYEASLGSASLLKLFASVQAHEPPTPTGSEDGPSGQGEDPNGVQTGFNCLPSDGAEPSELRYKLLDLSCLVFWTPNPFWVNRADQLKTRISDSTQVPHYDWLGYGDWICTFAPPGPLSSCRKHDVSYTSLQAFVGGMPEGDVTDEAWNPRNKALADAKLYNDVIINGCDDPVLVMSNGYCPETYPKDIGELYFWGVASGFRSRGWPITDHDLDHASAHRKLFDDSYYHAFTECSAPFVPTLNGPSFTLTGKPNGKLVASLEYLNGCIDSISIGGVILDFQLDLGSSGTMDICVVRHDPSYDLSKFQVELTGRHCDIMTSTDLTSVEFGLGAEVSAVSATVTAELLPNDYNYGALTYIGFSKESIFVAYEL